MKVIMDCSTALLVALLVGCSADAGTPAASRSEAQGGAAPDDAGSPDPSPAAAEVRFARDVLPVLVHNCTACHNTKFLGDYRTAETAWLFLTGPARGLPTGFGCAGQKPTGLVVPGNPEASALWQLVGVGFDSKGSCPGKAGMPKNDPRGILADFDPAGAETIRRWIALGARND